MPFNEEKFVSTQIKEIQKTLQNKKAMIAVSGGVDSTTCAALTHKAIGDNLICVIIDTGLMRKNEPEWVVKILSSPPLNLPMRLYNGSQKFYSALKGLEDAEEKRKIFRETFYTILGEVAKKEGCEFLIQGTIAPDWIETKGGIKSQHNILEQIGINPVEKYGFKVIEPLKYLYKDQVRKVARYLKVPEVLSERQPFPGPGLLVRVVGRISEEKVSILKDVTIIVEDEIKNYNSQQYFAAILDNIEINDSLKEKIEKMKKEITEFFENNELKIDINVLKNKATGVKGDVRAYGHIAVIEVFDSNGEVYLPTIKELNKLHMEVVSKNPEFSRILYLISDKNKGEFLIAVRAVTTRDFMTASITDIPSETLLKLGKKIKAENNKIAGVYYDITQKPPATVEFE
ncbi:MAG: GMP synthase (glutamine-hydrolyzing) [Candidatus Odinarchaeia archaeon]